MRMPSGWHLKMSEASGKKGDGWRSVLWEVGRWGLVIVLLLPLRQAEPGPIDAYRVALGILLFVIFGGKLLYDIMIADILERRRQSAAKDVVTLVGMVIVVTLVVGLLMVFSGFLLVKLVAQARSPGGG